jgi:UDP-glucose 4-epimerase
MKKIMFLGGTGFIGKNLVEAFVKAGGYDCVVFGKHGFPAEAAPLFLNMPVCLGDSLDRKSLREAFKTHSPEILVHLVTSTIPSSSNQDMISDIKSNLVGTLQMLDLARECGVKKVVFLSSGGTVYGIPRSNPVSETAPTNPICSHGIGKLAVEKYLQLYHHMFGLEYLICRVSNPYGEYHHSPVQGLINVMLRRILKGEEVVIWGDGTTIRDYIYVKDVADAILKLVQNDAFNQVVNIGRGQGLSVNQVLTLVQKELGSFPVRYEPGRAFDVPALVLDSAKLRSLIPCEFTSVEEGLRSTVAWLRKYDELRERAGAGTSERCEADSGAGGREAQVSEVETESW